MANAAEKEIRGPETDAEGEAGAESAVEREMTPEEAEREFEDMRDDLVDEAVQRVEGFGAETASAVADAEAKGGQAMSNEERAKLSDIESRAVGAKDAFVRKAEVSDDELSAQVMASSWEQAQREAEEANAAMSPEDRAARQKEFSDAVAAESGEDAAKAELAAMSDEDIETAVSGIGAHDADAEAGKKAFDAITEKDVDEWAEGIKEYDADAEKARADLASVTDAEIDAAVDRLGPDDAETSAAKKDLESITDKEIDEWAEGIKEHDPDAAAEAKPDTSLSPENVQAAVAEILAADPSLEKLGLEGPRLLDIAKALIAAEALKDIGELKERLKEQAEARKLAATSKGKSPSAAEKQAMDLSKVANATPAKEKPLKLSEKLSKWFDDTFMKPSALTRFFSKISQLWKKGGGKG